MSTPTPSLPTHEPAVGRGALRLRLVAPAGAGRLDGGWWPRGRDLVTEVADLVEHFPAHLGRITGVLYSSPDWDGAVAQVQVAGHQVATGPSRPEDTHVVDVRTTDLTTVRLLVVPPDFNDADGEEALLAAATPRNAHSARDLLQAVTDEADVDPQDHWRDDGRAGWGHEAVEARPR